jgi:hypothetical protein
MLVLSITTASLAEGEKGGDVAATPKCGVNAKVLRVEGARGCAPKTAKNWKGGGLTTDGHRWAQIKNDFDANCANFHEFFQAGELVA